MPGSEPPRPSSKVLFLARRFGPLVFVAAVAAAAIGSGLTHHLALHEINANRRALEALVAAHPLGSTAAYVGLYAALVAFSLPTALAMTLAGGMLFGPWVGGVSAAIGCTLGATAIFAACRSAFGDVLRRRAGPLAARIEAGVDRDAFFYVVSLRLIPIAPFWLVNLALGFFDIPLAVFTPATFLGILPVSLVYAGLGADLAQMFARGVHPDLRVALEPRTVVPLIGLAMLALAPIVWRRLKARRVAQPPAVK